MHDGLVNLWLYLLNFINLITNLMMTYKPQQEVVIFPLIGTKYSKFQRFLFLFKQAQINCWTALSKSDKG